MCKWGWVEFVYLDFTISRSQREGSEECELGESSKVREGERRRRN